MPTVSVVIPAFNAQAYLAQAIESVMAQDFRDWELVVVDDGSDDDTSQIARRYSLRDARIRSVRQANAGTPSARNRGFDAASNESPYLLFLDSDDLLETHAIQALLTAAQENPWAKALFGRARYIDHHGEPVESASESSSGDRYWTFREGRPVTAIWSEPIPGDVDYRALLYGSCIRTPGLALIRRASLEETGLFDTNLPGIEDWDLWIRMGLKGRLRPIDRVLLSYRIHGGNQSSRTRLMQEREMIMRRKLIVSAGLSDEQKAFAIEALEFHHLRRGRLPLVRAARRLIARASDSPGAVPNADEGLPNTLDIQRRDLLLLISLGCNDSLARKVVEGRTADFSDNEVRALRRTGRSLAREQLSLEARALVRRLRGRNTEVV